MIEPVLLYLYMFNICLGTRETCINKGVECSYEHHFATQKHQKNNCVFYIIVLI